MPASRRARGDQLPILEADGWILEGTEGVLEADSPFRVPLSVTILLNPPAWGLASGVDECECHSLWSPLRCVVSRMQSGFVSLIRIASPT